MIDGENVAVGMVVGEVVDDVDIPPLEVVEPLMHGAFAVYELPAGDIMLVTDVAGRGTERRVIPAKLMRMAMTGPFGRMFGKLFGGGES